MSAQDWDTYALNLAGMLTRTPVNTIMNLDARERYFGFIKESDNLTFWLSDALGSAERRRLHDAGWPGPDSDDLWRYQLGDPDFAGYRDMALAATQVMREVFEIAHPTEVRADAWVEEHPDWPVPLSLLDASTARPVPHEVRALMPIAETLLTDHPWLVRVVEHCLIDPGQDHRFGPWRGLLTELGEPYFGGLGILAQFDWKQDPDQVRDLLQRLPSHPTTLSWDWFHDFLENTAQWDPGDNTEALLSRVSNRCATIGFALVALETESDDYAVTFLPAGRVDQLTTVTAQAGQRVSVLGPRP